MPCPPCISSLNTDGSSRQETSWALHSSQVCACSRGRALGAPPPVRPGSARSPPHPAACSAEPGWLHYSTGSSASNVTPKNCSESRASTCSPGHRCPICSISCMTSTLATSSLCRRTAGAGWQQAGLGSARARGSGLAASRGPGGGTAPAATGWLGARGCRGSGTSSTHACPAACLRLHNKRELLQRLHGRQSLQHFLHRRQQGVPHQPAAAAAPDMGRGRMERG